MDDEEWSKLRHEAANMLDVIGMNLPLLKRMLTTAGLDGALMMVVDMEEAHRRLLAVFPKPTQTNGAT